VACVWCVCIDGNYSLGGFTASSGRGSTKTPLGFGCMRRLANGGSAGHANRY
jgi:hypothetical protein